jgi:dephospho-CoA kinase
VSGEAQIEKMPLRVGLTGGIASGKSTVADMFEALGAVIIDTDVIAREVVMPGQPALDEIVEVFGGDILAADGSLDRRAMRKRVFEDEPLRLRLEEILHPRIRDETFRQASRAGGPYQLIVVPLLAESPLKDYVDRILVVDCDEEAQVSRLLERDTETMEQAQRILAAQASREERLAIADDVIDNSRSLEDTRRQVEALHARYLGLRDQAV